MILICAPHWQGRLLLLCYKKFYLLFCYIQIFILMFMILICAPHWQGRLLLLCYKKFYLLFCYIQIFILVDIQFYGCFLKQTSMILGALLLPFIENINLLYFQGNSILADSGTEQLEFIALSQRIKDPKYQQKVFLLVSCLIVWCYHLAFLCFQFSFPV